MSETTSASSTDGALSPLLVALVWLWVLIPFSYGAYQLVVKIPALFGS